MDTIWLLLILPIASALVIHFILPKSGLIPGYFGTLSTLAILGMTLSLLGSDLTDSCTKFDWINVGAFQVNIGLFADSLALNMLLIVTIIGSLVHLFSLGYMKTDASTGRYFGNLSLFMFSMIGIIIADNLVMTFIFWELVGLSSYLLVGHWYEKDSAADAAKKAFLTNRVGDFGFLIGILMLWSGFGTVTFTEMTHSPALSSCYLSIALLLIFMGAMGKSAQAPLHVWLPDAMEGPTPVSALIHAATMVAAGIYMMARVFLSINGSVDLASVYSIETIAYIGGITSLIAALMATQQDDIKKILAYSTLSQLGYMVMAVGLVSPDAGMFHLYTHAWFKALLFLGSGAIIYACHHEQNIWNMGGLIKRMPITSFTFIFGTLALTAVPFTAGFYSKEAILVAAEKSSSPLLWLALGVAALTSFYMFRLIFVAILGTAKHKHARDAKEVGFFMLIPLLILVVISLISPFPWVEKFIPLPHLSSIDIHFIPHFTDPLVWYSIIAFIIGFTLAAFLYLGKKQDPLNIKIFREQFYIDKIYHNLISVCQDLLAAIIHFIDEFVISGLIVGGLARSATGIGNVFKNIMQNGNIQTYAVWFGFGIALIIYLIVLL